MKQQAREVLRSTNLALCQKVIQKALGEEATVVMAEAETSGISDADKLRSLKQRTRLAIQAKSLTDCKQYLLAALKGEAADVEREEKIRLNQAARAAIQTDGLAERQKILQEALGEQAPELHDMEVAAGPPMKKQIRHLNQHARRAIHAKDLLKTKKLLVRALKGAPAGNGGGKDARRQARKAAQAKSQAAFPGEADEPEAPALEMESLDLDADEKEAEFVVLAEKDD
jgi:hypothetical protein